MDCAASLCFLELWLLTKISSVQEKENNPTGHRNTSRGRHGPAGGLSSVQQSSSQRNQVKSRSVWHNVDLYSSGFSLMFKPKTKLTWALWFRCVSLQRARLSVSLWHRYQQVQTRTDQYRPWQTSTDQYRPWQTSTDQDRPGQTSYPPVRHQYWTSYSETCC